MALIGHAIMGDVTYEPIELDDEMNKRERKRGDRMCLHAYKLSLPLNDGESKSFCAPDPFVYIKGDDDCGQGRFIM